MGVRRLVASLCIGAGAVVCVPSVAIAEPPLPGEAIVLADDSVPAAGWFHVSGPTMPAGTSIVRFRNVAKASQVGLAYHGRGPLDLWFRAPGLAGQRLTIAIEALDEFARPLATVGLVKVTTGNQMLPLPANSGIGRRMVVHSDAQQVWLVEADGRVSDTFLMSGRRIRTASGADQHGVFRVYSRSGVMRYCSPVCGTANHMVRYQRTAVASVGSHSLPVEHGRTVQGVDDLGWPLSHGCTRLEVSKAKLVFRWATLGTTVVVL
ncbi:MAG: L,D-transpeptidase [Actinomycetota bacterium]